MRGPGTATMVCLCTCLLFCSLSLAGEYPVTAILGALDAEVAQLEAQVADRRERQIEGIRFVTGTLKGRAVALARTGVGKVNAAMIATLMIEHFRPDEVLFTGVAGGVNPDLQTGDIVIAVRTAHHDLGTLRADGFQHWGVRNPVTGKRNPVFFPSDPRLVALAEALIGEIRLERIKTSTLDRMPGITKGVVATGDMFVASPGKKTELRELLQADAVEMEGAAVAQICWQQKIPCLVIRSLSDLADEAADRDFEAFCKIAARNSAALVALLVEQLGKAPSSGK